MSARCRVSTARGLRGTWLSALATILGACDTELLAARFGGDAPGTPPGAIQELGTLSFDEGGGSVLVVERPAQGVNTTNWAHVSHPTADTPATSLRVVMDELAGDGSFTVSALLWVPAGGAITTVQLEPFGRPDSSYLSFLHVDLLPDGTLRIDDGPETFGHYPHEQVFILAIELEVNATGALATVAPSGSGTSGSQDVVIAETGMARHFGAVRLWMSSPQAGDFYVDNVLVLDRTP